MAYTYNINNKFRVHGEDGVGTTIESDLTYDGNSERKEGCTSGTTIHSQLINTGLRETSLFVSAYVDEMLSKQFTSKVVGPNSTLNDMKQFIREAIQTSIVNYVGLTNQYDSGTSEFLGTVYADDDVHAGGSLKTNNALYFGNNDYYGPDDQTQGDSSKILANKSYVDINTSNTNTRITNIVSHNFGFNSGRVDLTTPIPSLSIENDWIYKQGKLVTLTLYIDDLVHNVDTLTFTVPSAFKNIKWDDNSMSFMALGFPVNYGSGNPMLPCYVKFTSATTFEITIDRLIEAIQLNATWEGDSVTE